MPSGTGNAIFLTARCFPHDAPFDVRFNRSGGEDIWLIKQLVEQGERLIWARQALVEKIVPSSRATEAYLKELRLNQGRLRCLFQRKGDGRIDLLRLSQWMIVGCVQTVAFGILAAISTVFRSSRAAELRVRTYGGLDKVFWWRDFSRDQYGV